MHALSTIVAALLATVIQALPQGETSVTLGGPTVRLSLRPYPSAYTSSIRGYAPCGGFSVKPATCPEGYECIDDARIENSCGMACDRPGICVKDAEFCGGIAGFQCPKGKV